MPYFLAVMAPVLIVFFFQKLFRGFREGRTDLTYALVRRTFYTREKNTVAFYFWQAIIAALCLLLSFGWCCLIYLLFTGQASQYFHEL